MPKRHLIQYGMQASLPNFTTRESEGRYGIWSSTGILHLQLRYYGRVKFPPQYASLKVCVRAPYYPHFYSIYVDDLLVRLSSCGEGSRINEVYVGSPMYADDLYSTNRGQPKLSPGSQMSRLKRTNKQTDRLQYPWPQPDEQIEKNKQTDWQTTIPVAAHARLG